MANADMNRLMDNARIRLPGALDGTIQLELFSVLNDFFQSSNIWTEEIPFDVVPTTDNPLVSADNFTYEVTPTMGSVVRLLSVRDSKGNPVYAAMPELGFVVLKQSPSANDTYVANVSLTVTDPVSRDGYPEFPAWVLNKYNNDILDGVLGRMMSQIAKPYTQPNLAAVHLKAFKDAVSQAKVEAAHQNVYRGQNWRFPQSFARRRIR